MAQFICEKQGRCCPHEFYDSIEQAISDSEDGVPCDHLIEVNPVRHGRWIRPHWKNSNYCCDCSECGGEAMHRDYQWYKNGIYPICPNCGAKMDGGTDHG